VAKRWRVGDCVRLADGRIGRVRALSRGTCKVRVRRKTSESHEFLMLERRALKRVNCPKGWMSREGYARYLKVTLAKMREREAASKRSG
jgi:hypothetical protein